MSKKRQANRRPQPDHPAPESVVVGFLSGGATELEFTSSLSALAAYMMAQAAADPTFPRLRGVLPKRSGPRIAAGRNSVVEHFLALDADWLFMVDDDMEFAADAVDQLMRAADPQERPIVGGLAIAGGRDGWFPTLTVVTTDGVISRVTDYPPDALVPVDATGAACLLVHRSVFEKMAQEFPRPWQWFQETSYGEVAVGEDITFCLRARALGFPTFIHTGVKFGHSKQVLVTEEWWQQWTRNHRYVITGTGRCGTGYLAMVMSALGIDCGHETVFGPKATGWGNRRGEASWMAVPFLEQLQPFVMADLVDMPFVVHLVRNPLDVVNSLMGIGFFDDEPIEGHHAYLEYVPDHVRAEASPLERACRFVVEWLERSEALADVTLRVESLTGAALVPLVHAAGAYHSAGEIDQKLAMAPKDVNHRPRGEYGWGDVTDQLRAAAVRYGYEPKET